ncbi:MAG: helix-turn-helix transcriptional regulator [Burkholderiales bacterium]|nr:helix-turn-helix transcriptional regulator [Burkholderiales bacterium]
MADRILPVNTAYFDGLFRDRQISRRALCTKMGMDPGAMSLALRGRRAFTLSELQLISDLLSVPIHDVLQAVGLRIDPPGARHAPLVGILDGTGRVSPPAGGDVVRFAGPADLPEDCAAIQARTAGTAAHWLDGAVLFFEKRTTWSLDPSALGRLCLAQAGDTLLVGHVERGYRQGLYNLSGIAVATNLALEGVLPILWIHPR